MSVNQDSFSQPLKKSRATLLQNRSTNKKLPAWSKNPGNIVMEMVEEFKR